MKLVIGGDHAGFPLKGPVVDFLRGWPEVDKRRISLVGQSFGGFARPRPRSGGHPHARPP